MTNPKNEAKVLTLRERLDAQLDELVAEAAHLTPGPNITTYRSIALDLLQQLGAKDAQAERQSDFILRLQHTVNAQSSQLAEARAALEKAEAERDTANGALLVQRHVANEFADAATSAMQWIKNIRDGISQPSEAIENMRVVLDHCYEVSSEALATTSHATSATVERIREKMLKELLPDLVGIRTALDRHPDEGHWVSRITAILNRADGEKG